MLGFLQSAILADFQTQKIDEKRLPVTPRRQEDLAMEKNSEE